MSVALRSLTNTTYAARANTSLAAPAGIADGDLLVLALFIGAGGGAPPVTPPSGFTLLDPTTVVGDYFNGSLQIFTKTASGESGGSYTLLHTSASTQAALVCIQGSSLPLSIGESSSNTGYTSTFPGTTTALSVNTTAPDDLVLYVAHDWEGTGTLTPPTGYTERLDSLVYIGDRVFPSAGATGDAVQTNSNGTGSPWTARLIAITAAAAATPSPISGHADTTFAPMGAGVAAAIASGNAATSFALAGAGIAAAFATGHADTTFAPTAAVSATALTSGNAATSFTPTGAGIAAVFTAGNSDTTFALAGAGAAMTLAAGNADTTFAPTGAGIALVAASGRTSSAFALTGQLTSLATPDGAAEISSASTMTARAVVDTAGFVTLACQAEVTVTASRTGVLAADITAESSLTADGRGIYADTQPDDPSAWAEAPADAGLWNPVPEDTTIWMEAAVNG